MPIIWWLSWEILYILMAEIQDPIKNKLQK